MCESGYSTTTSSYSTTTTCLLQRRVSRVGCVRVLGQPLGFRQGICALIVELLLKDLKSLFDILVI